MRLVLLVVVLLLGHVEGRPHHEDLEQVLPQCVKWSKLRESDSLVSVNSMGEIAHTFSSCLVTCLKKDSSLPIIMVGHSNNSRNVHQFLCICASYESSVEAESSDKCDVSCPDNGNRVCGNADQESLSVYCTRLSCSNNILCNDKRPNCVSATGLDRKSVRHVNVEQFKNSNLVEICSKECKTMNMSLALTSGPEERMCLCTDTIDPDHVVSREFCDIMGNADQGKWLDIRCVAHDEPEQFLEHELGADCSSSLALACIYDELLPLSKQSIVINTMNEDIVHNGVQKCRLACKTLFPSSSHLAIGKEKFGIECVCLEPNVLNLDLVGPAAACEHRCGTNECGGNHLHPAKSVYCLHKRSVSSRSMTMSTDSSESVFWEERTLARLEAIDESLRRESVLASLIVGLLTFLALLVLALVAYLCHANGVLVLSK